MLSQLGFSIPHAQRTARQSRPPDIIEFDTFTALNDLIASNVFPNTTHPVPRHDQRNHGPTINSRDSRRAARAILFFDGVHPTTAAQQILAQQLAAALPGPGTFALLAAALLVLVWFRRAARA